MMKTTHRLLAAFSALVLLLGLGGVLLLSWSRSMDSEYPGRKGVQAGSMAPEHEPGTVDMGSKTEDKWSSNGLDSERMPSFGQGVNEIADHSRPQDTKPRVHTARVTGRLAIVESVDELPDWVVPYGEEFWRPDRRDKVARKPARPGDEGDGRFAPGFHLTDAIMRYGHSLREQPDGSVGVRAYRYSMDVSPEGALSFSPHLPHEVSEPVPNAVANVHSEPPREDPATVLIMRTADIRLGNRSILHEHGGHDLVVFRNTAQLQVAPGILQHIESRAGEAEMSWILHEMPSVDGDLTVHVELDGLVLDGETAETETGVHFADAEGQPRIRMTRAIAVDVNGRLWPVEMSLHERNALHMTLASHTLQHATYPLAIDPVLVPQLGKDINVASDMTMRNPEHLTAVGTTLFFTAWDTVNGQELWKSDGTAAGTTLVKNLMAGNQSSQPRHLTALGDTLFFVVNRGFTAGVWTQELWKSDGTEPGTMMMKSIQATQDSATIDQLTPVGTTLYFQANNTANGRELWKSDGTVSGTVIVKDIYEGWHSSPRNLTAVGQTLFFSADDGTHGRELWKSDGTAGGTMMVNNIREGGGSIGWPNYFTVVGETLFFVADDGVHGSELWKSDGTEAGTVMVKDIFEGSSASFPQALTVVGNTLFFAARDGVHGYELWKSDGTEAGTVMVKDIFGGSGSSMPAELTAIGDTLFFSADDGIHASELWKSDGTEAGTVMVKDISPGDTTSPRQLTAVGALVFFVNPSGSGNQIWRSDGTPEGTFLVNQHPGGSASLNRELVGVGERLFFTANREHNEPNHLWKSDGTMDGTVAVQDSVPGAASSSPDHFTRVGDRLFFTADDGVHGRELWKTDGTAAGTVLVKDIVPGSESSSPDQLLAIGETLFFRAGPHANRAQLWKSDGTREGTVLVRRFSSWSNTLSSFTAVGDTLFFTEDASYPLPGVWDADLWKSDGTEAGTLAVTNHLGAPVRKAINLVAVGDTLYFSAHDWTNGQELWKSDGTEEGTVLISNIRFGSESSSPEHLFALGEYVYFSAADAHLGRNRELWKSDGTEEGTVMVKDINPGSSGIGFGSVGPRSSDPRYFTNVGNTLFFSADHYLTGRQLWKSDGTEDGTVLVKNIREGLSSSEPLHLTVVGSTLFFTANDGVNGRELWKSDGTEAGTVLVKDIYPGLQSSNPQNLTAVGETLLFWANDGIHGFELWRSDGTPGGTRMMREVVPGAGGAPGSALFQLGGKLLFAATTVENGTELWWINLVDGLEILEQPSNQSVTAPNAATFSVSVDGADVSYQWERSTTNGESWSIISGATSSSYNTGSTSMGMNGFRFRVVITNSAGSMTSAAAVLTVNSAPSPSGNSLLSTRRPDFTWPAVSGAAWYQVWVSRNGSTYHSQWVEGDTTWTPADHWPGGNYSWWVRGWGPSVGLTAWSAEATFRIPVQAPSALTLVAPHGTQGSGTLAYRWERDANATWYRLWVGARGGVTWHDRWFERSGSGETSASPESPATPRGEPSVTGPTGATDQSPTFAWEGGSYSWWLRGWGPDGFGPWSGPAQFTRPHPAGTWYRVYVSRGGSPVVDEWTQETSLESPVPLSPGDYAWWLGVWDPVTGRTLWSGRTDFQVE